MFPFPRTFQTFEPAAPGKTTLYDPTAQYAGGMYAPPPTVGSDNSYFGDGGEATEFDSEPPLLEGMLNINIVNIE